MPNCRNRNRRPSRVRGRGLGRVCAFRVRVVITLYFLLFPLDCTCNAYAMLVHSIRIPRRAGFRPRRPRPCRHHRRKRGVNARHCVRPCRTGSPPSRRAVRLQGRLTPLETRARIPANVSERRNAAPPVSDSGDRVPRPACRGSTVANIGTPPDSPQPFAASRFR